MITSASTRVQHLRCVRSLHHYPAVCNLKYQEAFNKTTEVDNTQGPNSSPSLHLVLSYLLPFALHQNQNITALTYSLPQAAEPLTYRASRESFYLLCAEQPAIKECYTAFGPMLQLSCSVGAPLELPVKSADTLPAHVLIPGMGVTMACENLYDKVQFQWALQCS